MDHFSVYQQLALVVLVQLEKLDEFDRRRQRLARYYTESLSDYSYLELPAVPADRHHAWHLYVVGVDPGSPEHVGHGLARVGAHRHRRAVVGGHEEATGHAALLEPGQDPSQNEGVEVLQGLDLARHVSVVAGLIRGFHVDVHQVKLPYSLWTPIVFFPFLVSFFLFGLLMPFFLLGFPLVLISFGVPLGVYIWQRNLHVEPHQRVLTPELLQSALVVRRGDTVRLKIESSTLTVSTTGTALLDGATGDTVRARNSATGAEVLGRVLPDGSLLVVSGTLRGRRR